MDVSQGLDRAVDIYDQALFWVDYYGPMNNPTSEVCATVYFPNRSPIPLGYISQEQAGGFLRGKRTVYRVYAGGQVFPDGIFNDYIEARGNVQQRTFPLGIGVLMNDPPAQPFAQNAVPFTPGTVMFSTKGYGGDGAFGGALQTTLMGVTHFPNNVRPPVAFLINSEEQGNGRRQYSAGFQDDEDIHYICRTPDEQKPGTARAESFPSPRHALQYRAVIRARIKCG